MVVDFESAKTVLQTYLERGGPPDRPEIVAHATLSALAHHWPSRANEPLLQLLKSTLSIRTLESSRWLKQRRIAIAKIARLELPLP